MTFKHFLTSWYQYKIRLTKQECRSFHRPALHFPINQEIRFQKVKTAPKLKDKSGRKLGKGGDFGEGLRKTGDLTLKDTSKLVMWEYSVSTGLLCRGNIALTSS
jgi:hypothetical protein